MKAGVAMSAVALCIVGVGVRCALRAIRLPEPGN
jgi:hypothetical protein